jgi:peptidoglycan/LPS O-acetylase OafA/YrhL
MTEPGHHPEDTTLPVIRTGDGPDEPLSGRASYATLESESVPAPAQGQEALPDSLAPRSIARQHARFPALDGMRAIAALSIVAFHVWQHGDGTFGPAKNLVGHLNSGVVLFFLLSGFLLYRPFVAARREQRDVSLSTYFNRRIMRIVPAYWLALFVLAIWPGLPGFYGGPWAANGAFLQIYSQHWGQSGLAVAWSLCTEVTFYAALPVYAVLIGALIRRASPSFRLSVEVAGLAVLAVVSLGVHIAIGSKPSAGGLGYTLPATAYLFCGGMLLAACSVYPEPLLSKTLAGIASHRGLCWLAALVLLLLLTVGGESLGPTNPIYAPLAFILLLPVTLAPRRSARLDRFLSSGVVATVGLVSYGIYLWHDPLVTPISEALGSVGRFGDGLGLFLATSAAACIVAIASYRLVERPALAFAHRFTLTSKARSN